jgi:hypothetical protein
LSDRRPAAVAHMLAAAAAPPSEQIQYGMLGLSFGLPAQLLQIGERSSVILFLNRLSQTVIAQREYLTESADAIRSGSIPQCCRY